MDPKTVAVMAVAGVCTQLVPLVIRRLDGKSRASLLHPMGLAALGASLALGTSAGVLADWVVLGLAPLLSIAGFCLEALALVEAAGCSVGRARRTISSGGLAAAALYVLASALDRTGSRVSSIAMIGAASLSAYVAVLFLRSRERTLLVTVAGIVFALNAAVDAAIAFTGYGFIDPALRIILYFAGIQFVAALVLLLGEECSARRYTDSATHDTLTGILNRNGFVEAVEKSISLCARHNIAFSIICFDIDGFKAINESDGLAAGDGILVDFANRMSSRIRGYDHFCRTGGDEFMLFLQTVDHENIRPVAERLMAGMCIGLAGGDAACTDGAMGIAHAAVAANMAGGARSATAAVGYRVSAGGVCVDFPSGRDLNLTALNAACGAALSEAKRKGGGRLEVSPF